MEELSLFLKKAEKKQAKKKAKKSSPAEDDDKVFKKDKFTGLDLNLEEIAVSPEPAATPEEVGAAAPSLSDDKKEVPALSGDVISDNVLTIQAVTNATRHVKTWEEIKNEQRQMEAENPPSPPPEAKEKEKETKPKKFVARGNRNATGTITVDGVPKPSYSIKDLPTLEEVISGKAKKAASPTVSSPLEKEKEKGSGYPPTAPVEAPPAKENAGEKAETGKAEEAAAGNAAEGAKTGETAPSTGVKKYTPPSTRTAGAYKPPTTTSAGAYRAPAKKEADGKPAAAPTTATEAPDGDASAAGKPTPTANKYVPPSRVDGGRAYRPPPPAAAAPSFAKAEGASGKGLSRGNEGAQKPAEEAANGNHPTTTTTRKYVPPSQRAGGAVYRPPTSSKTEPYRPPTKRD